MVGRTRQAFTLMEMVAILVIVAMAAGAVTWSLRSAYSASQLRDAAERLAYFDRLARHVASRIDRPVRMVIDLNEQQITCLPVEGDDDTRETPHSQTMQLPRGISIEEVWLTGGRVAFGDVQINCSARGQTPSYALLIEDADGNQHLQIVAGLTGQAVVAKEEWQVDELFAQLSGRSDTD